MNCRRLLILVGIASMSAAIGTIAVSSSQHSGGVFAAALATQNSPVMSDEIRKLRAEWVKDLHTKQLDQIYKLYAEDAEFLLANGYAGIRSAGDSRALQECDGDNDERYYAAHRYK
jgi:hypothetical protein